MHLAELYVKFGDMFLALLLAASLADWTPARWNTDDPKSLELIQGTPINCLLLEEAQWSREFIGKAAEAGIVTLGLVHPAPSAGDNARRAIESGLHGVVLEGDFQPDQARQIRSTLGEQPVIELASRYRLRLDERVPILGTWQGVWPGIEPEDEDSTKAAPSGAPWIHTNTGFLRFMRAANEAVFWIGVKPPDKGPVSPARYLQAIGDAAIVGARWVVALDPDFERRLFAREEEALADWRRLAQHLKFYEDHKHWRRLPFHGLLALVQDTDSGALLSGGILDMIAVKHTPVRPVPARRLRPEAMQGSRMAVNVDPEALTPEQKEALRTFTRSGGTLLSGPPGWKFPALRPGEITLGEEEVEKIDSIWKEVNAMTGRRNLGARLFNVSSMLSNLLTSEDGQGVILHLVNYSDYPVENVTAHVLGRFKRARLLTPEGEPQELEIYPIDEGAGTGIDIEQVAFVAAIEVE